MNFYDLPVDDNYVWLDPGYTDHAFLRSKVKKHMGSDDAVTAWICINDVMAVDLSNALEREGFRIPDDVSVVGFDNSTYPGAQSLTTLEVNVRSLGQRAIEQLMLKIASPGKPYETLSIGTSLIIRDSVKKI